MRQVKQVGVIRHDKFCKTALVPNAHSIPGKMTKLTKYAKATC